MDGIDSLYELATGQTGLVLAGVGAAVAGLVGSVHCFAMCGPLACAGCVRQGGVKAGPVAAYHLARVVGYSVAGALFGGLGGVLLGGAAAAVPGWLAWVVAALLVTSALGLFERLPEIPGVGGVVRRLARRGAGIAPGARPALFGAITPLLPCGLLYGLYAATAASGSALAGATLAGAFALGAVPALLLAQFQGMWLSRLPRGAEFVVRRVVPLTAAVALVYRASMVSTGQSCH